MLEIDDSDYIAEKLAGKLEKVWMFNHRAQSGWRDEDFSEWKLRKIKDILLQRVTEQNLEESLRIVAMCEELLKRNSKPF